MSKKITTEEWVAKAKKVHKDKYDYSNVVYTTNMDKVLITCTLHGGYRQVPCSHIAGNGCPVCGTEKSNKSKNKNFEYYFKKFLKVHKGKYSYPANFKVINSRSKIRIKCSICKNSFTQTLVKHAAGDGCPHCVGNVIGTTESFIAQANTVHSNMYDYSKVNYINVDTKVTIVCHKHGEFMQTPYHHIKRKQGCNKCRNYFGGFNNSKPGILYYLKIETEEYTAYKIGITNRSVVERYEARDLKNITVLAEWNYRLGQDARNRETEIKRKFKNYKWEGPALLKYGNTEMFTIDILELDGEDNES